MSMVFELKLRKIGNSVGVILPKEALNRLNVQAGDSLVMTESTDKTYRLAVNEDDFKETMNVMKDISRRYRNTLRELAK